MDDFKRKKKFGLKEKCQYFKSIFLTKFLTDTLAKISRNIFAYSYVSEHSKYFLKEPPS